MKKHAASHTQGKRVLAVRAMAAEVAWLADRPAWRDGRVVWLGTRGMMTPDGAALAHAQRRLRQIARYPHAGAQALGDLPAWLAYRHARLMLAKQLQAFGVIDLPELARRARDGHAPALETLATLLIAEAYCLEGMPLAPSRILAACGVRAIPMLASRLVDTIPPAARALTALILGAMAHAGAADGYSAGTALNSLDAWSRRAYAWGLEHGPPAEPALAVQLLRSSDGPSLMGRYLRTISCSSPFTLPALMLGEALALGTSAATMVALAEAATAASSLADRLLHYRHNLPECPLIASAAEIEDARRQRREAAEEARRRRSEALASVKDLLYCYARTTHDPAVVSRVTAFVHAMLDMASLDADTTPAPPAREGRKRVRNVAIPTVQAPALDAVLTTTLGVLRQGLELPVACRRGYVELLAQEHACLWDRAELMSRYGDPIPNPRLAWWLEYRHTYYVLPMRMLLEAGIDACVVRDAVRLGIQKLLNFYRCRDAALCCWMVTLARDLELRADEHAPEGLAARVCALLSTFSDIQSARVALVPFFQAVQAGKIEVRTHFLVAVFDEVQLTDRAVHIQLPALATHVPQLLAWCASDRRTDCLCTALVAAALALAESVPDRAVAWLDWLLSYLRDHPPIDGAPGHDEQYAARPILLLAIRLAEGDFSRFQAVARTLLSQLPATDAHALEHQTLPVLARYPAFGRLLIGALPGQSRRCLDLLLRLGRIVESGGAAPLDELELYTADADRAVPACWRPLLVLSPHLSDLATRYLRAQRIVGGTATLPAGVRHALILPHRLTVELAHLERLVARQPARADLAARAANLRARLSDSAALLRAVREEAGERLRQAAILAELSAAEALVHRCIDHRLHRMIGPASACPADLDRADLFDATLFTAGLRHNRRLMLRLLRGYTAGDRQGLASHPANEAFLADLAAHGVEVATWLGAHPRAYASPEVAGGKLHLRLERDPLCILQMGTLFSTCLSTGGSNAHAAVANACELNKRVLYVRDAHGRIVGRQLLGVTDDWRLVGFRIYSILGEAEGAPALRAVILRYIKDFAERSGLALADDGTVPTLFAPHWYDDGAVPWEDASARDAVAGPSGGVTDRRLVRA